MYSNLDTVNNEMLEKIEVSEDNIGDLKRTIINTKKTIIKEVSNLNSLECVEIFKILKKNNINYSENVNGIFVNMASIKVDTLNQIVNFINYVKKKNIELHERETNMENTKKKVFGIESKINTLKENLEYKLESIDK